MDHFEYKNGALHAEDVPLEMLAQEVGTPFYVYSDATLTRHYEVFVQGFQDAGINDLLVAFAVKANSNIAVLKTLAQLGAGADVVSGGELARALIAGIPPERIVFSGVGKTRAEMAQALKTGIHMINVESVPELKILFPRWLSPWGSRHQFPCASTPMLMPKPMRKSPQAKKKTNLASTLMRPWMPSSLAEICQD